MNYTEFIEQLRQETAALTDANVLVTRILKNNGTEHYIMTLLEKGGNTAPAIHLETYYRQYLQGSPLKELACQILQHHSSLPCIGRIDTGFFTNFTRAAPHIVCRIINYDQNRRLLSETPHRKFLDLAIVYYFVTEDVLPGTASILIKNAHLKFWEISEEELDELAAENTLRLFPYRLFGVGDLLKDFCGKDVANTDFIRLHVLTNCSQYYGAVLMSFQNVLLEISETLDSSFYLMPSSVHECMILPDDPKFSVSQLHRIVCEINDTHVSDEEILGTTVYYFDRQKKELLPAESDA